MKSLLQLPLLLLLIVLLVEATNDGDGETDPDTISYGPDMSWPMQQDDADALYEGPLGHQLDTYRDYMDGCYERYSRELCDANDEERIEHNLNQPRYQVNFTHAGYAKIRAPTQVYTILRDYWNQYNTTRSMVETWDTGNVYVNHWEAPTTHVPLDLPQSQRQVLLDELKRVLEQWSQTTLIATSVYGIRVYHQGSILAAHVDRLPLVISAIINVAQGGLYEPWPLEVIGHNGKARNITLDPGEMILYQSSSIIHGRPFPLQGDASAFYADVFLHFEPLNYSEELEARMKERKEPRKTPRDHFELALESIKNFSGQAIGRRLKTLPGFIKDGSEQAKRWRQEFVFYREENKKEKANMKKTLVQGVTTAHLKAANGKLEDLKNIHETDPSALFKADANGWKPIHEAARGGNTQIVEFLIQKGADVNERTNNGQVSFR